MAVARPSGIGARPRRRCATFTFYSIPTHLWHELSSQTSWRTTIQYAIAKASDNEARRRAAPADRGARRALRTTRTPRPTPRTDTRAETRERAQPRAARHHATPTQRHVDAAAPSASLLSHGLSIHPKRAHLEHRGRLHHAHAHARLHAHRAHGLAVRVSRSESGHPGRVRAAHEDMDAPSPSVCRVEEDARRQRRATQEGWTSTWI